MRKFATDRRGVTSLEYALLAAALAVVLLQVLQVPAQSIGDVVTSLLASTGGASGGGGSRN